MPSIQVAGILKNESSNITVPVYNIHAPFITKRIWKMYYHCISLQHLQSGHSCVDQQGWCYNQAERTQFLCIPHCPGRWVQNHCQRKLHGEVENLVVYDNYDVSAKCKMTIPMTLVCYNVSPFAASVNHNSSLSEDKLACAQITCASSLSQWSSQTVP